MVEYKKKKLILQSGGTRNYYYKVSSDGKKKQVSKNEYLKQKGGHHNNPNNANFVPPPIFSTNTLNANALAKRRANSAETMRLFHEKEKTKPEFFKKIDDLIKVYDKAGSYGENMYFLGIMECLKEYYKIKYTNKTLMSWDWFYEDAYKYAVKENNDSIRQGNKYINWNKFTHDFLRATR